MKIEPAAKESAEITIERLTNDLEYFRQRNLELVQARNRANAEVLSLRKKLRDLEKKRRRR